MRDQTGFIVDPEGVRAFGTDARSCERRIADARVVGLNTYVAHPLGSKAGSPAMHAAIAQYTNKLIDLIGTMAAFERTADVLARSAETIATAYERSDTVSGQSVTNLVNAQRGNPDPQVTARDPKSGRPL